MNKFHFLEVLTGHYCENIRNESIATVMEKYTNYKQFVGIAAKHNLAFGSAHIVRKSVEAPSEVCGTVKQHHLELSLNASTENATGCYPDYWSPDKFEPFGDVFFIPAGQNIRIKSNRKRQTSIVCTYEPDAIDEWYHSKLEWTDLRLQNVLNIENSKIRMLLLQLSEEIRKPGRPGEKVIELFASQVAIELIRYIKATDEERITGGLSPWRLKRIDQRIAEFSSQPTLEELAGLCHISLRQLTRAFRISRNCSLGNYIATQRTEHAKSLIAAGESIKSVAYTMGFSAPSNFTATFTRITGQSPREFQRNVTNPPLRQCAGKISCH